MEYLGYYQMFCGLQGKQIGMLTKRSGSTIQFKKQPINRRDMLCTIQKIIYLQNHKKQLIYYLYLMQEILYYTYMNQFPQADHSSLFHNAPNSSKVNLNCHSRAILLFGCNRASINTVFNWTLNKPLVDKRGPYQCQEVPAVEKDLNFGQDIFSLKYFQSKIYYNLSPNLSLVNMGILQENYYVNHLVMSCFSKFLFEKARKIKFVMILDESAFWDIADFIRPFQEFIKMFNFAIMTDQIKDMLKQSISLVIMRSKNQDLHLKYISQLLEQIQSQNFQLDNKTLITQLLTQLRDSARVEAFKNARENQIAEKCAYIQKFDRLGWQFFDLDSNQAQTHRQTEPHKRYLSLISIPFRWSLDNQRIIQKHNFKTYVTNKINSYLSFPDILHNAIDNLLDNWKAFLEENKKGSDANFSSYKMDKLFDSLRNFISKNDVYNTAQIVNVEHKIKYQPVNLVDAIKSILKLPIILANAGSDIQNLDFKDVMQMYQLYFPQMINTLKIFATSKQEELLFERTIYILKLSFLEFKNNYKFGQELIHDIKIKLIDNCTLVFPNNPYYYPWDLWFQDKFMENLDQSLLIKLFPTTQTLKTYEQLFNQYANEKASLAQYNRLKKEQQDNLFIAEHRCLIQIAKAELSYKAVDKQKALGYLVKALQKRVQIYIDQSDSEAENEVLKFEQLNNFLIKSQALIAKMQVLASTLNSDTNIYKLFALQLSKCEKMIKETCSSYKNSIQRCISRQQKLKLYQEYSKFCLQWGKIQEAAVAIQGKLSLLKQQSSVQSQILMILKNIMINKQLHLQIYAQCLRNLQYGISFKNQKLDDKFEEIQTNLKQRIINLNKIGKVNRRGQVE